MKIEFPQHVVEDLRSQGFFGDPEHLPFQAKGLSEGRAYLIFSWQIAYVVTDSDWERASMATVALTDKDKETMAGRCINLENIKGIERAAWLFPDGSMQYADAEGIKTTQYGDGTTSEIVEGWCNSLAEKESSWTSKLMGQRQMYTSMRIALSTWLTHLKSKDFAAQV